jgi:hypothetical protein
MPSNQKMQKWQSFSYFHRKGFSIFVEDRKIYIIDVMKYRVRVVKNSL